MRVEATNEDRVRSRVLGCWLRVMGDGGTQRLHLAADPSGDALVPTSKEKLEAENARLRAELARRER